ncbi:Antitoxin SocA [Cupriavidus laharis]|uniref:Antitoxin SocA n=1 Tax=Cupriavidus laharis TaxID=151654 RepID=A0ABM8X7Y2_9BURK|nr:type II toxin-antitoxin system antitoxin SocA domain-containing protein [Cupriavidus laharis]CAG9176063.1 Antitoxin SocA [Cupriavidus laharis]
MAYPTMAVANAFIQKAKEGRLPDLSPMKLQKLLYFAQSWHLKWKDGEPLIDDTFSRWKFGPVIPSLYHEFKHYGASAIDQFGTFLSPQGGGYSLVQPTVPADDAYTWAVIDEVIRAYGGYSGAQLSGITHRPESAWTITGGPDGGPISNEDLMRHIG